MFRFRRPAEVRNDVPSVIADECESFLSGTYVPYLLERGVEVPPWAWMNGIAHGSTDRLVEVAATPVHTSPAIRPDHRAWRVVIRAIAGEILAVAEATGIAIDELQALSLVPIEFAMMVNPVGPRTALRIVGQALQRSGR